MWTALESTFSAQSSARVVQLRTQLQTIRKGSSSLDEYFQRIKSLADALAVIRQPVSESDLVLYNLTRLGPEYDPFSSVLLLVL